MRSSTLKMGVLAGALWLVAGTSGLFAQADALVDMLQKKGLLTQREANDVKEQMFTDIRETMPGTKIKVGGWLDELKIYGDARVRYEQFWDRKIANAAIDSVSAEQDRTRYRLRLRVGMEARAGDWAAGFRLASGDTSGPAADAVSTNTTFDNYNAKKNINIDMAYLTYAPSFVSGLKLTGGKFENTFWETDMVYDGDLTPEGFSEQYTHSFGSDYSVFGNFAQWVLAENNVNSGTAGSDAGIKGKDAYMMGWQVGHQWSIVPKKLQLKQALAYYDYTGLRNEANTIGTNVATGAVARNTSISLFGNTVPDSSFNVFTVNNEVRLDYWKLPVRLQGEYIHNFGKDITNNDSAWVDGYKVGGILGEAKKKGQWQVGYWYEYLEPNATLSYFSDSDFGNGGTNEKGHIIKASYQVTDWVTLGMAYWNVTAVADVLGTGAAGAQVNQRASDTQRFQFDVVMKF